MVKIYQEEGSLEEKLRFAIDNACHTSDFRYGEGEKSLKQKPVKRKLSTRIF